MASNTERQKAYNDYQVSQGKQRVSTFISSEHKTRFDSIKLALGVTNEVCLQMLIDAYEVTDIPAPATADKIDKMFEDVLNQLAAMQASFAAFEARLSAIEAGAVSELTSVKEVSLDVRLVAVAMKAAKKTNEEIQAYIGNATGKRFSFSFKQNLSNNLENWKRAADKQL
ncbi:hypothetical protein [Chromatium okenii]|uniref:Uncharacterized protein n=1 Tax=Chromatium okenii TaxID=61644 RepID=A0A2S7XU30_9GAMM|nr:hypothetical protein [Chromatium okenii]PQJ96902.1 hypothetical protein CXB77_05135 [Chromatium okenii]